MLLYLLAGLIGVMMHSLSGNADSYSAGRLKKYRAFSESECLLPYAQNSLLTSGS
jgi:hypothetical protein